MAASPPSHQQRGGTDPLPLPRLGRIARPSLRRSGLGRRVGTLARAAKIDEAIEQVEPEGCAEAHGEAGDEPPEDLDEPVTGRHGPRVEPAPADDGLEPAVHADLRGAEAGVADGQALLLVGDDAGGELLEIVLGDLDIA